jgi:uncharacterized protein (TIGR03435 family)
MRQSSFVRLTAGISICAAIAIAERVAQACTAFCAIAKDQVLVGNNEDWTNPRTKLWFIPAASGSYGRMYVGFDDLYPQGGMNERGLWFDGFAALPIKVEESGLPRFDGNLVDKAMAECTTVEEVVRLFSQYDRRFLSEGILMFADATGDAASIEANAIVRKSGPHFVQTNFHQSRGPAGGSVRRFTTATSMLDAAGGAVSVDLFRRILDATHQSGGSPTLYSNIYDLRARTMLLYYFHDYEHPVRFDLTQELKKGAHVLDIPALFPVNAAAQAYAARREKAQRNEASSGVPEGVFLAGLAVVPLILLGLSVFAWVKGGREVRLVIAAAAFALVLAIGASIATLHLHRQASPAWVEFRIGPSAGKNAWISTSLVRADGLTVRQALATAFDVPSVRVIGPEWINQVRYSIHASVPPDASESFRGLLREELESRLNLKTHTEPRPYDAFVLTAGGSPRLERGTGGGPSTWIQETDIQMQDGSMKDLASALQGILGKPVVNETGIEGTYNMQFEWTEDRPASVTAVLEQRFGLRLAPARRDFDTLIIDDIRREPALVLMDHIGRMTTAAPPSFRRKLARFFSVE